MSFSPVAMFRVTTTCTYCPVVTDVFECNVSRVSPVKNASLLPVNVSGAQLVCPLLLSAHNTPTSLFPLSVSLPILLVVSSQTEIEKLLANVERRTGGKLNHPEPKNCAAPPPKPLVEGAGGSPNQDGPCRSKL